MSASTGYPVSALKAGDRFMLNGRRHLVEWTRVAPHPSGDSLVVRMTLASILFAPGERVRLISLA